MSKNLSSKKEIDMLNGPLLNKIILFALPLAATGILQQLFNAADMAVVGKFASSTALAAVGSNAPIVNLIGSLFMGTAMGANVVIANAIGANDEKRIKNAVHTAISFSIILGVAMLIIGEILARPLLRMVSVPSEVMPLALLYLRLLFIGSPFLLVYNFAASILRSKGDTKRPLYILIFTGILNVALNIILVLKFKLSVEGVAISTIAASVVSALIIIRILQKEEGSIKVDIKNLFIDKGTLKNIIRIGVPAGIQGMVFSLSNTVLQGGINTLGKDVIAGSAAGTIFEFICFFAINSFAQTATTFVGQNYGAGNYERCKRVFRYSMLSSILFCGMLNLLIFIFRNELLMMFTTEKIVASYAVIRMTHVLIFQCLASTYEVTAGAMRGFGYSMTPALVTIFGTCIVRIAWVYLVFDRMKSFTVLINVYPVTWVLTGAIMLTVYFIKSKKVLKNVETS